MASTPHAAEQVIAKIREAEVLLAQGMKVPQGLPEARRHGANLLPLVQRDGRTPVLLADVRSEHDPRLVVRTPSIHSPRPPAGTLVSRLSVCPGL
jgi:hypothetical protein